MEILIAIARFLVIGAVMTFGAVVLFVIALVVQAYWPNISKWLNR